MKIQDRGSRLYRTCNVYLCSNDIRDGGHLQAAIRATGVYEDEVIEIKSVQDAVVYAKVAWYRVCRQEDQEVQD